MSFDRRLVLMLLWPNFIKYKIHNLKILWSCKRFNMQNHLLMIFFSWSFFISSRFKAIKKNLRYLKVLSRIKSPFKSNYKVSIQSTIRSKKLTFLGQSCMFACVGGGNSSLYQVIHSFLNAKFFTSARWAFRINSSETSSQNFPFYL